MSEQPSPEQIAAFQEKIKNMSPEELKEFQKKQCIFCQIIEGKIQAKKVYEDEDVIALLDINPANPGHILLLPKEHYAIMPQVPKEVLGHLFVVAKSLSNVMLRALGVTGSNIIVANGVAAGQKAQHFMAHIIPRTEKDGIEFTIPQQQLDDNVLNDIASKIRAKLGSAEPQAPNTVHPVEAIKKEEHKDHQTRKEHHDTVIEAQVKEQPLESEEKDENPQDEGDQQETSDEQEEDVDEPQETNGEDENQDTTEQDKPQEHTEKESKKEKDVDLDDIADLLGK